jgi:hypothetical protein
VALRVLCGIVDSHACYFHPYRTDLLVEITRVVAKRAVKDGVVSHRGIIVLFNLLNFCQKEGKEGLATLDAFQTFVAEEREDLIVILKYYEEKTVHFVDAMLKCITLCGGVKNILPIMGHLFGLAWTCWCKRDTQTNSLSGMMHKRFDSDQKETENIASIVALTSNLLCIVRDHTSYFDHVFSALVFHGFIELWSFRIESLGLVFDLLEIEQELDEEPEKRRLQCMNLTSNGSRRPLLSVAEVFLSIRFVKMLRLHPDADFPESNVLETIKKLISESKSLQKSSILMESIDHRFFKSLIVQEEGVDGDDERMELTPFAWKKVGDLVSEIIQNDFQGWIHLLQSTGSYPSKESYLLGLLPPNEIRMTKLHLVVFNAFNAFNTRSLHSIVDSIVL